MADFIHSSNPAIQTTRKFAAGCGPDAPKTSAAFKWLTETPNPSLTRKRKPALAGNSSGSCRQLVPAPILGGDGSRERVEGLLSLFRARCREVQKSKVGIARVDLNVFMTLQEEQGAALRASKQSARSIGAVPGVEVECRFKYRAELLIAGLHSQLQNGIDSVEYPGKRVEYRGWRVASCVVATEGYYDRMNDPDVLVYRGEGGKGGSKWKRKPDQVMKGGNLALKNSIKVRNEVRVVRGLKVSRPHNTIYVYDGLYEVVDWKTKTESEGNKVFYFEMRRKPGQPRISWKNMHLKLFDM